MLRSALLALALVAALSGCEKDESRIGPPPLPGLDDAARRTLAAGPAQLIATVRAGNVSYRLRGRWDPTGGYRVCAVIDEGATPYLERRVLWLDGRDWEYGTLTAHGGRCRAGRMWFDDHPPTLELFDIERRPAGGRAGAEDYLHAALLALGGLSSPAVLRERAAPCARSRCHRAAIDFDAFDREPSRRDEDGWTLRPLLRRLGVRTVEARIDPRGYVDRVRLVAPRLSKRSPGRVRVALSLAAFGEEPRVPYVQASAYE